MIVRKSGVPRKWIVFGAIATAVVIGGLSWRSWVPLTMAWVERSVDAFRSSSEVQMAGDLTTPADAHAGHTHGHQAGHDEATSIELSPQAMRNLGLTADYLRPIELTNYRRAITIPAVVVAKPGRTSVIVSSPLNGIVTHVHAVTGEAVLPGELLFEVRLTYEDLVETQTAYLKTISELQVEDREIARLEEATQSGVISGKFLLERRYAKEKLEAFARSQREALRMHGLSQRQVDEIRTGGTLLRDLQVLAPDIDRHEGHEELHLSQAAARPVSYEIATQMNLRSLPRTESQKPLVIDELQVHKGQAIAAGEKLCSLSDYSQLFIEGKAFEADMATITEAATRDWGVEAVMRSSQGQEVVRDMKLAFVANAVDPESRTLSLFVELPNEIVRDQTNAEGQRFLTWKYRLGQRLELKIPVEEWKSQIVLPVEAVVKDGADWFVFQKNGSHFDRVAVHLRYRDQFSAVVANDGSIAPGDIVARKSAHQLQMAIKNKSGDAVDAHAGHNH